MASIKSYTDIEQSKKLTEILPLESADMYWYLATKGNPKAMFNEGYNEYGDCELPCWSLSALLDVLPNGTDIVKDEADTENEKYMCTVGIKDDTISTFGNNPVDACVAMIEKLHKLNLL